MSGAGAVEPVCNGTTLPTSISFQIAAGRPYCGYVGSAPTSSNGSTLQSCCTGPVLNGSQYDASEAGSTGPRTYEGCIVYCQVEDGYAERPTKWQQCVEPLLPSPSAASQWTCAVGRNESISGAVVNGSQSNNGGGAENGASGGEKGVKMTMWNSVLPLAMLVLLGLQVVLPASAATAYA